MRLLQLRIVSLDKIHCISRISKGGRVWEAAQLDRGPCLRHSLTCLVQRAQTATPQAGKVCYAHIAASVARGEATMEEVMIRCCVDAQVDGEVAVGVSFLSFALTGEVPIPS